MSFGSLAGALEAQGARAGTARMSSETLTVCHIISGDLWAGAEAQAAALLRAMARKPGLRLVAILLNEGRLAHEARNCGVEVEVIPEATNSFPGIVRRATAYLRRNRVQVLHSHRYKENLLAALLARRCGVPIVIRTEHGAPEPFRGLRQLRHRFMVYLDRFVGTYGTDAVISVSAELEQHLSSYLDQRKIVVVPNGLDLGSVYSALTPSEAKKRLNLPADCNVIGYAGRLAPVKRLDLFLAAAEEISARDPEARFLLVGEGSEESRLRQIVATRALNGRVVFLGHRDDIYDVLRAFDVFLLCSDHEGLPMVLLEILHLAVPVVARCVGGVPEVVQNGASGLLINSDDPHVLAQACLRMLHEPDLRARLANGGTLRVASLFSADSMADRIAELYRSLYNSISNLA